MKRIYFILPLMVLFFGSCQKEDPQPDNPFVNQNGDPPLIDTIPSATIQSLHQHIFSLKCANPTCHDGTFEPDFRTIESTYNSLVYVPVTKNDTLGTFTYRVLPGDHENSWIHERLTTNDPSLGRMPLYAPKLQYYELQAIIDWIDGGAKDKFGDLPVYPNTLPEITSIFALGPNSVRYDQNRPNGPLEPFVVPNGNNWSIYFSAVDDDTPAGQFALAEVRLSTTDMQFDNPFWSSAASVVQGNYFKVDIASGSLPLNTQFFIQVRVKDATNPDVMSYPNQFSSYYRRHNASFIIQ
ncbi:MAG: hypothetical protein LPK80_04995 [Bacteroidota bacterium]|nr:hypothetical protein [Bacteroidota bacterium]